MRDADEMEEMAGICMDVSDHRVNVDILVSVNVMAINKIQSCENGIYISIVFSASTPNGNCGLGIVELYTGMILKIRESPRDRAWARSFS